MKPGNYQLVETKAPKGYQLDASPINFTIDKAQAKPLQITVSNKKLNLLQVEMTSQLLLQIKKKTKAMKHLRNTKTELLKNKIMKHLRNTKTELPKKHRIKQITNSKTIEIRINTFQIQVIKKTLHKQ